MQKHKENVLPASGFSRTSLPRRVDILLCAINSCQMPSWFNLPNLFTFLRLLLLPFIIQAILTGRHQFALAMFAIAAATDVLDGAAARHLGLETQTGAYFDPIADKCLLSGVFVALAAARILPWWLTALVIGRDLYILLGALTVRVATGNKKFPPTIWGKASTFVQILTVVIWMARDAFPLPEVNVAASAALWACAAATIWSGLHYTWLGLQFARAH
jgi:cardiolipin synthase (CMP-forming)